MPPIASPAASRLGRRSLVIVLALAAAAARLLAQGTPAADQPVDEAQVETKPAVIPNTCQSPAYPMQMRVARIEGHVILQFVVDTLGHIEANSIRVVQASHALFESAARRAVVTCRYSPARQGNHPVRVRVQLPFNFRMNEGG